MRGLGLLVCVVALIPVSGFAQTKPSTGSQTESVQDLLLRLTPEQKQQFEEASNAFKADRYADSLVIFREMLKALPGDAILSKFASEAALDTGDTSFALATLKPIAAATPDDWQSTALLARACAESGDKTCRDSEMAHMLDLYSRGMTPPRMQAYILERIKLGDDMLIIRPSLVPWGPYKVYDLGQVLDKDGKVFLRITIESADFDQPLFAEQHPKEAAEGVRRFSLDAYRETGLNANGQRTQTHFTFEFFDGQPPYDTLRQKFIDVANGKSKPQSSRTGIPVQ